MKRWMVMVAACAAVLGPAGADEPAAAEDLRNFSLYIENDKPAGSDQHYTNGLKLTWTSRDLKRLAGDARVPEWVRDSLQHTPLVTRPGFLYNVSFSIGQNIYTPRDTESTELVENDRPYAGWTYVGMAISRKHVYRLDTIELNLGLTGEASLAEQTQVIFHEWLNAEQPNGWDHQLSTEPGIILNYEQKRRWRLHDGEHLQLEMLPHAGITVGNIYDYVNAGSFVRWGLNVPDDFGTSFIRPGGDVNAPAPQRFGRERKPFGLHVFAGVDGRAVARNLFLDGNTFSDSHSVDKEPFVADLSTGVGLRWRHCKLTAAYVYRTREFEAQEEAQEFGALTFSVSY